MKGDLYGVALNTSVRRSTRSSRYPMSVQVSLFAGTVQVDGDGIHYSTVGSVEKQQHTVVFLHGIATSSQVWRSVSNALAVDAYALTPDLPGHGRSEGAGRRTALEYADFVERFLDALGLHRRVVLVGHDLGAATAMVVAARCRRRVAGLFLMGLADSFPIAHDTLAAAGGGECCEAFWLRQFAPGALADVGRPALRMWQKTRPEVRFGDLLAMDAFQASVWAPAVDVPTMFLVGAEDRSTPPDAVRELAHQMVGATVEEVAGAGHMLMLEDPLACHNALQQFLSRLPICVRRQRVRF